MKEKAQLLDLELVDVKSNGSCMFAALAHQLGRNAEDAEIIRSEITAYMRRNEPSMVIVNYHFFVNELPCKPRMCSIPLVLYKYIIMYYFRLPIILHLINSTITFHKTVSLSGYS